MGDGGPRAGSREREAEKPVEAGRVYGSIEEGTARVLHQPPVIHPGDHFSTLAIGHALDWFQTTLEGAARPLPPHQQVWRWKEVGNLTALAGMVILLLSVGTFLLRTGYFNELAQAGSGAPPGPPPGPGGAAWWVGASIFALLPKLSGLRIQCVVAGLFIAELFVRPFVFQYAHCRAWSFSGP